MSRMFDEISARMKHPQLNKNFNDAVSKRIEITEEDKRNYELAHKAFQEYIKEEQEKGNNPFEALRDY